MKYLKELTKLEQRPEMFLDSLFIIYVLFDIDTPNSLANLVDNTAGKTVVVLLALSMFIVTGPITGVLALLVAYTLIKRSSHSTGSIFKQIEHEGEEIKMQLFNKFNSNSKSKTLEEDVITDMAPIIRNERGMNAEFKPVLGKLNNASPIDYANSLAPPLD